MADKNKDLMQRSFTEVWNKGDFEALEELYAVDLVFHDPSWPEVIEGREALKQYIIALRTGFPDLTFVVEEMLAEGDKVLARWVCSGTHNGEMMGIPATGIRGGVHGMTLERFEGGKIKEAYVIWDALGMMRQLGVIPPM